MNICPKLNSLASPQQRGAFTQFIGPIRDSACTELHLLARDLDVDRSIRVPPKRTQILRSAKATCVIRKRGIMKPPCFRVLSAALAVTALLAAGGLLVAAADGNSYAVTVLVSDQMGVAPNQD